MGKEVIGSLVVAHGKVTGDASALWARAFYRRDVPAPKCFSTRGGIMPPLPLRSGTVLMKTVYSVISADV